MAKKGHFKEFRKKSKDVTVDMSFDRFYEQYQKAQYELDSMVMTDMKPYMPHQTGTFINITSAMSTSLAGTGKVVAAAPPMGRFLYEGKVMVDPETGSPWARSGVKKIVTEKVLTYSNPKATPKWFETAKQNHGNVWIDKVKKTAGGR